MVQTVLYIVGFVIKWVYEKFVEFDILWRFIYMKKKLINVLIFFLVFFGFLLLSRSRIEALLVEHSVNSHLNVNPDEFEANLETETEFYFDVIDSIELGVILDAIGTEVSAVGEVIIPSVGIHLPIFHGTTNATLSLGAGTMTPDQRMGFGNYSLASHRMLVPDQLFTPLDHAEIGERIFLRDAEYVYIYEITEWEIIHQTRVDVIDYVEGETLVTLITCAEHDLDYRILVRGEFIEQILIEELYDMAEVDDDLENVFEAISTPMESSNFELILRIGGIVLIAALLGLFAVWFTPKKKKKSSRYRR